MQSADFLSSMLSIKIKITFWHLMPFSVKEKINLLIEAKILWLNTMMVNNT